MYTGRLFASRGVTASATTLLWYCPAIAGATDDESIRELLNGGAEVATSTTLALVPIPSAFQNATLAVSASCVWQKPK